jgi:hypothetical protein
MARACVLIGMSVLAVLVACGEDDAVLAPCATDGGDRALASKDSGQRDSGSLVWTPRDAGMTRPPIANPVVDAGNTQMCAMRRAPLPSALLPRCSPATGKCLADCTSAADPERCRDACIDADATPAESQYGLDCAGCIYLQLFACVDAAGCHDGVADAFCCIAEKCPAGSPESCGQDKCGEELMTSLTCGYFANMACTDFSTGLIALCYGGDVDADAGE